MASGLHSLRRTIDAFRRVNYSEEDDDRNESLVMGYIHGYYKQAFDRLPASMDSLVHEAGVCFGFLDPVSNIIANAAAFYDDSPAEETKQGQRGRGRGNKRRRSVARTSSTSHAKGKRAAGSKTGYATLHGSAVTTAETSSIEVEAQSLEPSVSSPPASDISQDPKPCATCVWRRLPSYCKRHVSRYGRCFHCEHRGAKVVHPTSQAYLGQSFDFEEIAREEHDMTTEELVRAGELSTIFIDTLENDCIYFDPAWDADFAARLNRAAKREHEGEDGASARAKISKVKELLQEMVAFIGSEQETTSSTC